MDLHPWFSMKLVELNDHELIIRDRPGLFKSCFILVWSSFFIGIPSLMMVGVFAGVGPTRLSCDRPELQQLSCEIAQSNYMGLGLEQTTTYSQVIEAKFNQREGTDSDGDDTQDNWVSLVTSKGDVILFEDPIRYNGTRGSEIEMLALTDQINGYIQEGLESFRVERDLSFSLSQMLFPVLFASLFLIIGLGVVYWTFQVKLTRFDRNSDRVFWKRYSLLGVKSITIPFIDIHAIAIDEQEGDDGPSTYVLCLEAVEHDRMVLGTTHWSRHAKKIKSKVQNFLDAN